MTIGDIAEKFRDQSIWLVCGGPSVRGFDFSRLNGLVAAINEIGRDIPNLDLWFGNDRLPEYPDDFWSTDAYKLVRRDQHAIPEAATELIRFKTRRGEFIPAEFFEGDPMWGVSTREHGIKKSTMLLAIGILYRLGIREVRLIGCDWRATQDAPYGHDHKETDETSVQTSNDHFGYLEEWFTGLLPVMERLGFRIINCTDGGYLEIFERADWMDYLVK